VTKLYNQFKLLPKKISAFFNLILFLIFELKKIKKSEVVLFFPFYHTGGAEKVHLNIVNAISNNNTYILFTNKSESIHYKDKFSALANCYEVYEFINRNAFIKKIFIKTLSKCLNKNNRLQSVFGCNSMFYYDFLPFLSSSIKKIDLIHAFSKPDYGLEMYSLSRVELLNTRVVINNKTYNDFVKLYSENKLDQYIGHIVLIPNGLNVMSSCYPHKTVNNFQVIYVGRWAKEKRPEIFVAIAKKIKALHPSINFTMVGTNFEANSNIIFNAGINNKGEITNEEDLIDLYKNANVILITSYREGFPLVIMEAMNNGVVPITTNVGGINEHIKNDYNGYLIDDNSDLISEKFVQKVIQLYEDNNEYNQISKNAFIYAQKEFGIDKFNKNYRNLLLNQNNF
jgi:glycosyltransferase involved in cell wall biosynthesis